MQAYEYPEMLRTIGLAHLDLGQLVGSVIGLDDVPDALVAMNDPVPARAGLDGGRPDGCPQSQDGRQRTSAVAGHPRCDRASRRQTPLPTAEFPAHDQICWCLMSSRCWRRNRSTARPALAIVVSHAPGMRWSRPRRATAAGPRRGRLARVLQPNPTSCTMWVSGREIAVLAGRVYLGHYLPITPAGVS